MGRVLRSIVAVGTPAAWGVAIAMACLHVLAVVVLSTGAAVTGSVTLLGDHADKALLLRALADAVASVRQHQK